MEWTPRCTPWTIALLRNLWAADLWTQWPSNRISPCCLCQTIWGHLCPNRLSLQDKPQTTNSKCWTSSGEKIWQEQIRIIYQIRDLSRPREAVSRNNSRLSTTSNSCDRSSRLRHSVREVLILVLVPSQWPGWKKKTQVFWMKRLAQAVSLLHSTLTIASRRICWWRRLSICTKSKRLNTRCTCNRTWSCRKPWCSNSKIKIQMAVTTPQEVPLNSKWVLTISHRCSLTWMQEVVPARCSWQSLWWPQKAGTSSYRTILCSRIWSLCKDRDSIKFIQASNLFQPQQVLDSNGCTRMQQMRQQLNSISKWLLNGSRDNSNLSLRLHSRWRPRQDSRVSQISCKLRSLVTSLEAQWLCRCSQMGKWWRRCSQVPGWGKLLAGLRRVIIKSLLVWTWCLMECRCSSWWLSNNSTKWWCRCSISNRCVAWWTQLLQWVVSSIWTRCSSRAPCYSAL